MARTFGQTPKPPISQTLYSWMSICPSSTELKPPNTLPKLSTGEGFGPSIEEDEKSNPENAAAQVPGLFDERRKKNRVAQCASKVMEKGFYHTNTVTKVLVDSLSHNDGDVVTLKDREINSLNWLYRDDVPRNCRQNVPGPKTIEGYQMPFLKTDCATGRVWSFMPSRTRFLPLIISRALSLVHP